MTTVLISMMVFVGVAAVIGLLAFVFREGPPKTATRLDMLIGKRRKEDDDKADILRKTAFEGDKKSLMEMVTPKFVSLSKLFEQADCHIKACCWRPAASRPAGWPRCRGSPCRSRPS
jgi:hypothetical protein